MPNQLGAEVYTRRNMDKNEWVKQVIKDLAQDLNRANSRLALLSGETMPMDSSIYLRKINPLFLIADEAFAREALAAYEEE